MLLLASHLLLPRYFGRGVARGDAGGWRVSSDAHSRHGQETSARATPRRPPAACAGARDSLLLSSSSRPAVSRQAPARASSALPVRPARPRPRLRALQNRTEQKRTVWEDMRVSTLGSHSGSGQQALQQAEMLCEPASMEASTEAPAGGDRRPTVRVALATGARLVASQLRRCAPRLGVGEEVGTGGPPLTVRGAIR